MKRTKTPQIRFKGFCEDWEEKILGKEKTVKDGTHDSPKFLSKGYPLITSKNLVDNKVNLNDISYISEEDFFHINQRSKVDIGDILFGMIGTIGNLAIVKEDGFAIKNVALIKSDGKVPNIFISQLLVSPIFKKYIDAEMTGNTQKFLSLSKIRNFKFYCPVEHLEQTKIGDLFQKLDRLIELSKTQLEQTQTFKKAMLQRMFPQNGERAPKIRFKGFCENWERFELGNHAEIKTGTKDVQNAVENGLYPFFIRSNEVKKINEFSFDGEAILIPGEGRLGEIFHYINGKFDFHQRVYKISDFKQLNGLFVLYHMQTFFKKHAMTFTVKATVDSLRLPVIKEYEILAPTLKEQTKIGKFFQSLDQKIQSQQTQFNQYQTLKKALLQKMFV